MQFSNRETAVSLLQTPHPANEPPSHSHQIAQPSIHLKTKNNFLRQTIERIVIKNVVKCRKKVANIGFL
jgi:hypothetical protein